ncbi:MAG: cytochrome c [Gammaproteobacteria bacterium]|nr:cytochrome c [Gammaproteobacteria bacterium]
MKNKFKFAMGVLLLVPMMTGSIKAVEEVEIPFHLGQGQLLYEKYCSSCHGSQLNGSDKGPPLLHPFYKPSHHGDQSFYRAALQGVQQHHWEFGNMPPVEGMTAKKLDSLVPYVRYYQQQKELY